MFHINQVVNSSPSLQHTLKFFNSHMLYSKLILFGSIYSFQIQHAGIHLVIGKIKYPGLIQVVSQLRILMIQKTSLLSRGFRRLTISTKSYGIQLTRYSDEKLAPNESNVLQVTSPLPPCSSSCQNIWGHKDIHHR
jgi:hypothetical protein